MMCLRSTSIALVAMTLLLLQSGIANGAPLRARYEGAIVALRIVDGDTIQVKRSVVRIYGIDAPELHAYKCDSEKALAQSARARMIALLSPPRVASVERLRDRKHHVRHDKYGRVLGRVSSDGRDVAPIMIAAGLAHSYFGGAKQSWCQ